MTDNYEDIIHLPHHTSILHPRMSMEARAAQFAPFSALTGYDEAIRKAQKRKEEELMRYEEGDSIEHGQDWQL